VLARSAAKRKRLNLLFIVTSLIAKIRMSVLHLVGLDECVRIGGHPDSTGTTQCLEMEAIPFHMGDLARMAQPTHIH